MTSLWRPRKGQNMRNRVIGVLAVTIAAFAVFTGTALAEEPVSDELLATLIAQLDVSDDPYAVLATFTPNQQKSVIQALQLEKVIRTAEVIQTTGATTAQGSSGEICSTHKAGIEGKSIGGFKIWFYETKTV